jgi:hypothetical protein
MTLAATSSTRRLSTTILVTGFTLAALLTSGVKATAASTGDVPAAAVARLTALGFSDDEAAGLLRATRIRPASTGGAYAAQRIAMATLYGSADAFGGPRYRRPSS